MRFPQKYRKKQKNKTVVLLFIYGRIGYEGQQKPYITTQISEFGNKGTIKYWSYNKDEVKVRKTGAEITQVFQGKKTSIKKY